MKELLRLEDIWMEYHGEYVLKEVNLVINSGDYVVIRGKSGAGKTSLLKIMALLIPPSKGSVYFLGKEVSSEPSDIRSMYRAKYYGILIQGEMLIDTLTVYENMELALELFEKEREKRRRHIEEILKSFNMHGFKDRYPDSLSQGERQRISILRAVVKKPKILLIDEPYSNLDEENEKLVYDLLNKLNQEGTTIVITTTDLYDVARYPGKNYILKGNRLYPYP